MLTGWWGGSYSAEPVYYDYGNTIVYEGDTVYNGGEPVATADQYYEQASDIAAAGGEQVSNEEEWMSLGVWAMVFLSISIIGAVVLGGKKGGLFRM